jgi:hypothetical protein
VIIYAATERDALKKARNWALPFERIAVVGRCHF